MPSIPAVVPGPHSDRRSRDRALLAGSVPNLVQWFNLYVYAIFAPYFRTEFFRADSPDSLIYVYALFAVTFVVRPLGSWLFGRFADTRGRMAALVAAVALMSAGSVALAIAPTERVVGAWAAVILVIVSIVQGIAAGGEYAAATVLLSESGTRGHRGFFASFQGATIVGGLVLAQGLLLGLLLFGDRTTVSEWGWRVAFAAGGAAGLASLWWAHGRRLSASTAPAASSAPPSTMADLFRNSWRPLVWVMLLTAGGSAAFYTATVTVPSLFRETAFAAGGAWAELTVTGLVFAAFVVLMVLQPLGGALSDRIGRKPLLIVFGVAGILGAGLLVSTAETVTSPPAVFGILVLAFAVLTCYLSVNGIAKAEVFPAHIRALGVGFGYAVANSLFGGTAPLVYHASGGTIGFVVYLTALLGVTLVAALAMRGGRTTALDAGETPAVRVQSPAVMRRRGEPDAEAVVAELIAFVRALVGGSATLDVRRPTDAVITIVHIQPMDGAACSMTVLAEQFVILQVGSRGCRWELSFDGEDVALIRRLIAAVVAGHVEERTERRRSTVTITLDDGTLARTSIDLPRRVHASVVTSYRPYSS